MEVILLQRVEKLGQMGDVVSVKPGYARNYLIPKGFADRASQERIAQFEKIRKQLEAENLKLKTEAEAVAKKMAGLTLTFIRTAGDAGHLYGAIRTNDVSQAVTEAGFTITKDQVRIATPIKTLGLHEIGVALHPDISVPVRLNIALSEEEAKLQLQEEAKAAEKAEKKAKPAAKKAKKEEAAAESEAEAEQENKDSEEK